MRKDQRPRDDTTLSDALLARGLVSERAIEHARAVQRRGHDDVPLGELLVELEHLAAEDLLAVLADQGSPPPWDGPEIDLAVLAELRPDPRDDALDEETLRARWTPDARGRVVDLDGTEVRLVNLVLLGGAFLPGAALRLEAFDAPAIRAGSGGAFDRALPLPAGASRALLARCIWRLKEMAGAPLGARSLEGWVWVRTARCAHGFACAFEPTERGLVATVHRSVPWTGAGAPSERAWERWRARVEPAAVALRDGQLDAAIPHWRAALDELSRLGDDGILERITTTVELSRCLTASLRSAEALSLAEAALSLAEARELGPRPQGALAATVAAAEMNDLARRVALFERAEALACAPGVGRSSAVVIQIDLASSERSRGRHTEAREAAERARRDDLRWFGATTQWGFRALVESAVASAALDDAAAADASAREAARVGALLGLGTRESDWALGAALSCAGRHAEAVTVLERALSGRAPGDREEDVPFLELALARALDRLGRNGDALAVARRACAAPPRGLDRVARAELDAIARRVPYR